MRRLFPSPEEDVDPLDVYVNAPRTPPPGRPWVAVGMITSIDGATAVGGGVSGDLGGEGDRQVFRAYRAMADVILVGAQTVRAENYGPVKLSDDAVAARSSVGLDPTPPRLAILSGSLDFDPEHRVFTGAAPIIYTTTASAESRAPGLQGRAEIVPLGDEVTMGAVLADLGERGFRIAMCEGGPAVVGQLVTEDLIDEWCINTGGSVAGGPSPRAAHGAESVDQDTDLATLLVDDGLIAARWIRRR